MGLKISGIEYVVGTASVSRSIRRTEKYRVTTEDGVVHREVQATYMDFILSIGNFGVAAYNALMTALRASTDDVTVELPGTSAERETYTGAFDDIKDELVNDDGAEVIWDNLSLSFTGTIPLGV